MNPELFSDGYPKVGIELVTILLKWSVVVLSRFQLSFYTRILSSRQFSVNGA